MDEFSELIISRSTVESVSKQEIGQLMVGFTWRANLWRQPHKLIQVLLIQTIGISMIFTTAMLPVDRILNPPSSSPTQISRIQRLILVNGTITLTLLGGLNWWLIERGKRFKRLIKLVEQIETYNQIIQTMTTIAKVTKLASKNTESIETALILDVLTQTRHNLLMALEIDRHLRQYPQSTELSVSIAHNLLNLEHLAQQTQFLEYNTLITQAWEIGMSVYRETNSGGDK